MWANDKNLDQQDLVLNWKNLTETNSWTPVIMRLGQVIVVDLHDGGSGLVFAKTHIHMEQMAALALTPTNGNRISMFVTFNIANEYGGGTFSGIANIDVDLTVNVWIRPPKPPEFWNTHNIHSWTTYALPPLMAGVIRQSYPNESRDYDRQILIHPAFYGFSVRFRGHQSDEARFVHPAFTSFTLAKKPMISKASVDANRQLQLKSDPNPFKYDPFLKEIGKCPCCGVGIPGCPRCWTIPTLKNGKNYISLFN
jgi:hypothetical protein